VSMTYTTTDWIWERLSTRYGVTAAQQTVEDVFVRWLAEQNIDWGVRLVNFYFGKIPAATYYGDAAYAYWSGGVLREAVAWFDAANAASNEQSARAFGVGGSAYSARYGSSTSSDSNDPALLGHTGTNYLHTPGVAGNYASAPDSIPLSITGDLELVARISTFTWAPTTAMAVVGKWVAAGGQSYMLVIETTGALSLYVSTDGTTQTVSTSTVATGFAAGDIKWLKVTLAVNNGAAGRDVKFYTASDSATEPTVWTQLGTTVTTAGTIALFDSTAPLEIGSHTNGATLPFTGRLYRTIVRSGIGGTTVFDANFTTGITSGAQTTFTESSVNAATVTINRGVSGRKSVAVTRPVWLFGTDDYMESPADPEGAYVRTTSSLGSSIQAAYTSYVTGTATAGAASTMDDTTKAWTVGQYIARAVRITGGTGVGQVRLITANTATQLTISGTWTTIPDITSTYVIESRGNVNTDAEFVVRCSLDNWASGSNQPLLTKRAVGQYSYQLYISTTGTIGLGWTADGATSLVFTSSVAPFLNGTTYWIRVRRTASTGAWTVDYAADQATEPTSWTALSSGTGTAGNMWLGTSTINIGSSLGGSTTGNLKTVILRDGFGGNAVVYWQACGHPTAANYVNANRVLWQLAAGATTVNPNRMNFGNTDSFTVVTVQRTWATVVTSGTFISKWGGGAGWNLRNGSSVQPLMVLSDSVNSQGASSNAITLGNLTVLTSVVTPTQLTEYVDTVAAAPVTRTVFDATASESPVRIGVTPATTGYNDFELVAAAVIPRALTATEITAICKLYGTA